MAPLRPKAREGNAAGPFMHEDSVHVQKIRAIIVPNDSMIVPDLVKQSVFHGQTTHSTSDC
jgi:hypothetical protein